MPRARMICTAPLHVLAPDYRHEPPRKLLIAKGIRNPGLKPMLREQRRDPRGIDEDVLVPLIVTTPRAVVIPDERCYLSDVKPFRRT